MKTKSQKEKVLTWLKSGHTITPLQALQKYGSLRLSAIIFRLRKEGWKIKTEMIKVWVRSWDNRSVWIARYSL